MTDRTVRFIRNLRFITQALTVEELYQLALALRDECARRDLDCGPEAKALTAALLIPAQAEHRARFLADHPLPPLGPPGSDAGAARARGFFEFLRSIPEPPRETF